MVAADARTAITFSLSPGQAHDAPEGRALLSRLGAPNRPLHLIMDRAYEGNKTRQLALDLGFIPVVPPLSTRVEPWEYDRAMYKRRNEVERLFRRLKGYRRIFSRFEKLDLAGMTFFAKSDDCVGAIHVRSFAPYHAIAEDPVCGTGNISIAAYLRHHGDKRFGSEYVARQGASLGRDGRVHIRYDGKDIYLGGAAVTTVDGAVALPA